MSLYLTALVPPPFLAEEIDDIRKEISSKYGVFAALKPPVHITLFRPANIESSLETFLIKALRPVQHLHTPFIQKLENFDSFNNKTLFVACLKNPQLSLLQKNISAIYHKHNIDRKENSTSKGFHPHITVAYRDVMPKVFSDMWSDFKNRKFKRNFPVDRFVLFKHDGQKWNVLEEFPLSQSVAPTLF
jgi:2'-5' RNA ligase